MLRPQDRQPSERPFFEPPTATDSYGRQMLFLLDNGDIEGAEDLINRQGWDAETAAHARMMLRLSAVYLVPYGQALVYNRNYIEGLRADDLPLEAEGAITALDAYTYAGNFGAAWQIGLPLLGLFKAHAHVTSWQVNRLVALVIDAMVQNKRHDLAAVLAYDWHVACRPDSPRDARLWTLACGGLTKPVAHKDIREAGRFLAAKVPSVLLPDDEKSGKMDFAAFTRSLAKLAAEKSDPDSVETETGAEVSPPSGPPSGKRGLFSSKRR